MWRAARDCAPSPLTPHGCRVWSVKVCQRLPPLPGHSDGVNGVALSGDEGRAVSASSDRTLKVWDVESGQGLRTLSAHAARVQGVECESLPETAAPPRPLRRGQWCRAEW